jgi:hypothetical protein
MFGKKPEHLSRQLFGNSSNSVLIQEMLEAKRPISVEHLYKLCKAIGLEQSDVIKRVAELADDQYQDTPIEKRSA